MKWTEFTGNTLVIYVVFFVCGMMGRFNNAYSPNFNNWNGNAT